MGTHRRRPAPRVRGHQASLVADDLHGRAVWHGRPVQTTRASTEASRCASTSSSGAGRRNSCHAAIPSTSPSSGWASASTERRRATSVPRPEGAVPATDGRRVRADGERVVASGSEGLITLVTWRSAPPLLEAAVDAWSTRSARADLSHSGCLCGLSPSGSQRAAARGNRSAMSSLTTRACSSTVSSVRWSASSTMW
jgi:hypothetical protein